MGDAMMRCGVGSSGRSSNIPVQKIDDATVESEDVRVRRSGGENTETVLGGGSDSEIKT